MNRIQEAILDVFKEVALIVERHNYKYFAIGGTALGAVRHKGFIPWDDDLDIAMPIEDFDEFIRVAPLELPPNLELVTSSTRKAYTHPFIKVVNNETTLIEKKHFDEGLKDRFTGIWVDIMPLPGMPEKGPELAAYARMYKRCDSLAHKMKYPFPRQAGVSAKAAWALCSPLRLLLPHDYFNKRWLEQMKQHPYREAQHVRFVSARGFERKVYPKSYFDKGIVVPFESTSIVIPDEYDKYLTRQFGDYLAIPPAEEQVGHDSFADLKHGYREYQRGALTVPGNYWD